jgi:hypothetical protein
MNNIFRVILVSFIFLILTGCSNKKEEIANENKLNLEKEFNCNKKFYKGKILFGTFANLNESHPSWLEVEIGNKLCTAEINPIMGYQTNKLYFTLNQLSCNNKIIPIEGFILDSQCEPGIIANHKINEKLISYLESELKIFPSKQLEQELVKAKIGYLESEPNQEVFIQITEPFYFLHKIE